MKISKGFTLIELLIVIAILGILAAGVLVAIDPVDRINSANDSRVQKDLGAIGSASEAYTAAYNGFYPANITQLVSTGELKVVPAPPSGYTAYAVQNIPAGCVGGSTCTGIVITGQLKSKKYTSAGTSVWRYESLTGKSCAVAPTDTACP